MESLNTEELDLLSRTDFLTTKANALAKVNQLLSHSREELRKVIEKTEFNFPGNTNLLSGKISIGENYRGLPYQVLDYPSLFDQEDIFAFRTLFWWGNFFSVTFQLSGKSCDYYRSSLIDKLPNLVQQEFYICINESPWEHHHEADNYKLLEESDADILANHPFIKLSKKLSIDQYAELPRFSTEFLRNIISWIKLAEKESFI